MLEIGTGTGIIALCAALNGAKVTATDVNPSAVQNAKLNFKKYRLKISTRAGDMFAPVKNSEKFDYIFWNHPYHNSPYRPKNLLQRSGMDHGYKGLRAYFAGAQHHLLPGGRLLLGTSNIARLNEVRQIAKKNGYKQELLLKRKAQFTHRKGLLVDLRIYAFAKIGK